MTAPDFNESLLEIIGELGAAIGQSAPSDDPIIMEHIRSAYTQAIALRRSWIAQGSVQ